MRRLAVPIIPARSMTENQRVGYQLILVRGLDPPRVPKVNQLSSCLGWPQMRTAHRTIPGIGQSAQQCENLKGR